MVADERNDPRMWVLKYTSYGWLMVCIIFTCKFYLLHMMVFSVKLKKGSTIGYEFNLSKTYVIR